MQLQPAGKYAPDDFSCGGTEHTRLGLFVCVCVEGTNEPRHVRGGGGGGIWREVRGSGPGKSLR
jgi:hypothetical protein